MRCEIFATALVAYRAWRFDEARSLFEDAAAQRPGDGPTALYLKRIDELRASPPPPDWDGVTNLTSK